MHKRTLVHAHPCIQVLVSGVLVCICMYIYTHVHVVNKKLHVRVCLYAHLCSIGTIGSS